jgi:hypothetical protein
MSTKSLSHAINLSGRERMLIERVTKEALLIKNGFLVEKNIEKLKNDKERFERVLKGLLYGDKKLKLKRSKDKKIESNLKELLKSWERFKIALEKIENKSATKNDFDFITKNHTQLLNRMNEIVGMYVKLSNSSLSKRSQSVNLSGKLRMLTQKLSIELLENKNHSKTVDEFTKILNGLKSGDKELNLQKTKLPKIKKMLFEVEKDWKMILKDIKKGENLNKTLEDLDTLMSKINKMVKRYEISVNREKRAKAIDSLLGGFLNDLEKKRAAVNIAGKQRMLTQRVAKDLLLYSYFGYEKDDLIASNTLFNDHLKALLNGSKELNLNPSPSKEITLFIKEIRKRKRAFDKNMNNLTNSKKKINLLPLIESSDKLLKLSNELVQKLKKAYKSDNFIENAKLNIVDIAGRQRMLSQKMTKEKLLSLTFNDKKFYDNMKQTINLFKTSLKALIEGDRDLSIPKLTNKKIKDKLSTVKNIFNEMEPLYKKSSLTKRELNLLVVKNLSLLKNMDQAVKLYESELEY